MLAGHPRTELAGIWARRPEAADRLATHHATVACASFEELLDRCDALSFAVPPDVQAHLGAAGARAGKALLLEKPVALDLAGAEHLARAVDDAGVVTQLVLTWRYADPVRTFLAEAADADLLGGRGQFVTGGLLGGAFATPWRIEHGPLLDLGPHVVDLLDAALGPVESVRATGDLHGWVGLLLGHAGGRASEVSLCATTPVDPPRSGVELYSTAGHLAVDTGTVFSDATIDRIVDEFADAVASGTPHPLDVHRGVHLQRVLAAAVTELA
jgi:predicted dehydrogenase